MAEGPLALVPSRGLLSLLPLPPVWAALSRSRREQTPYREALRPTHSQWDQRATVGKPRPPPGEPSTGADPTLARASRPTDSPLPSVSTLIPFSNKVNHE